MGHEQYISPDPATTAHIILGLTANERQARVFLERNGLTPPIDFCLTPFDRLVLTSYAQAYHSSYRLTADDAVQVIRQGLDFFNYPSVAVTESDIHSYFRVLRGYEPGGFASQKPTCTSCSQFPHLRDAFNMIAYIRQCEKKQRTDLIGATKTEIQLAVATALCRLENQKELMSDLGSNFNIRAVLDGMRLDLITVGRRRLQSALLDAVVEYESQGYQTTDSIHAFRSEVEDGKLMTQAHYAPLSGSVNHHLTMAWLEQYGETPSVMQPWEQSWFRQLCKNFIIHGTGAANNYLVCGKMANRAGKAHIETGSALIRYAFCLDATVLPTTTFLDALYEIADKSVYSEGMAADILHGAVIRRSSRGSKLAPTNGWTTL